MSIWDLDFQRGWRVGLLYSTLLLGAAFGCFLGALRVPLGIFTFLLGLLAFIALAGAVYLGYWLAHGMRAEYGLDRNALLIHWGRYTEQIPLPEIIAVESETPLTWVKGVRWPGYAFGWARDAQGHAVRCYATGLDHAVVLRTAERAYALTPQQREAFLEGLHQRLDMGPTQEVTPAQSAPEFLAWAFWRDALAISLFLGGALLNLALSAMLFIVYPLLPATLTLNAVTLARQAQMLTPVQLFRFPAVGAGVWLLNTLMGGVLYRRERPATLLLWGTTVAFELALWVPVIAAVLGRAG